MSRRSKGATPVATPSLTGASSPGSPAVPATSQAAVSTTTVASPLAMGHMDPPPTAAEIAINSRAAATAAATFVAAHAAMAAAKPGSTTASTATGSGSLAPAPRSSTAQAVTPQPVTPIGPPMAAAPLPQVAPPPTPAPQPAQAPPTIAVPQPDQIRPANMPGGAPGAPGSPGSSGPPNASDSDSGEDVTKVSNRMDTRNIRVDKFTGVVPKNKFDSGAQEWWDDFQEEVETAQILSGQRWSDRAKKLLLSSFLDELARRWHKRYRASQPAASYAETGAALVEQFRPKMSYQDLTKKLIDEPRKFNESFREYADRLTSMAEHLEGGIQVVANQRHALTTFVRRAWGPLAGEYERNYELDGGEPLELLEFFLGKLSKDVGHDGRGTGKKHFEQSKRRKYDKNESRAPHDQARANIAMVERKRKPAHKPNNNYNNNNRKRQFACFKCGSFSHTAKYHDQYLSNQDDKSKVYGPSAGNAGDRA